MDAISIGDDAEKDPALLASILVEYRGGSHFGGEYGCIAINSIIC